MDYGAAVSQKGKDVKVTADRFFTVSSSFQSLKILAVHSVTTTVPDFGDPVNVITVTHNLGYFSPAIVVYNGSTTTGQDTSHYMSDGFYGLDVEIGLNTIKINIDDLFGIAGDTVYFTVYSFLDTFDSFTAPLLSTDTTSSTEGQDYGWRISKAGFDVKDCADLDCIISSSFYTTTVHKRGTDNTGTISHDLGYIPVYLLFVKFSGNDFLSLANYLTSASSTAINWSMSSGDVMYYTIFKSRIV